MINWTNNSPNNSQKWLVPSLATWTATGADLPDWIRDNKFDPRPWLLVDGASTKFTGKSDHVTWDGTTLTITMYVGRGINDWTIQVYHQDGPSSGVLRWPGFGATTAEWADPGAQAHDREDGDITHNIIRTIRYRESALEEWQVVDKVEPTGLYDIDYNVQDSLGTEAVAPKREATITKKIDRKPLLGRVTLGGEGGYPWDSFNFLDNGKMYMLPGFGDIAIPMMFGSFAECPNYAKETHEGWTYHTIDNMVRFAYGNYNRLAMFRDGTCFVLDYNTNRRRFTNSWLRDNVNSIRDIFTPSSYDYSHNIFVLLNDDTLRIMTVTPEYKDREPSFLAHATEILAINQSHNRDCFIAHKDDTVWHWNTTSTTQGSGSGQIMMADGSPLRASEILFITIGDAAGSAFVVFKSDHTKIYKINVDSRRNLSSFYRFTNVNPTPLLTPNDVVPGYNAPVTPMIEDGERFVDGVANEFHHTFMTNKRVHHFHSIGGGYEDGSTYGNKYKQFLLPECVETVSMLPATAYAQVFRATDGYYNLAWAGSIEGGGSVYHYRTHTHMTKLNSFTSLATKLAKEKNREQPFPIRQCMAIEHESIAAGCSTVDVTFSRTSVDAGDTQYVYEISTAYDPDDYGPFYNNQLDDKTVVTNTFQTNVTFDMLQLNTTYYVRVRSQGDATETSETVSVTTLDSCMLNHQSKFVGYTSLGFEATRRDEPIGDTQFVYELATQHDPLDPTKFDSSIVSTQTRNTFQRQIIHSNLDPCVMYYARIRSVGDIVDTSHVVEQPSNPCENFSIETRASDQTQIESFEYGSTTTSLTTHDINLTELFGYNPETLIVGLQTAGDLNSSSELMNITFENIFTGDKLTYTNVQRYQRSTYFSPWNGPVNVDMSHLMRREGVNTYIRVSSTCRTAVNALYKTTWSDDDGEHLSAFDRYRCKLIFTCTKSQIGDGAATPKLLTTNKPNTTVTIMEDRTAGQTLRGLVRPVADDQFGNLFIASGDGLPDTCHTRGSGRVVFDGGFPKFYNRNWSDSYKQSTENMFNSNTPGQWPYLVNAIRYMSSQRRVQTNKVLYVNDGSTAYDVAGATAADREGSAFDYGVFGCAEYCGKQAHFFQDQNGSFSHNNWIKNNPRDKSWWFDYLNQFDCVIWLGVNNGTLVYQHMLDAMMDYYDVGGGFMFITDDDAFQGVVNEIVPMWGVRFTDNINRSPDHNAYKISTILNNSKYIPDGQHPLFADISSDAVIAAGSSEGRVEYLTNTSVTSQYTSDSNGVLMLPKHNNGQDINFDNRVWIRTSGDCGYVT